MHILLYYYYVKPFPKLEKQRFSVASQSFLLIFTLVFLQVFLLAFANINTGSTLTTNDNHPWLSPSGEFAFGFRQLNGTSTSSFSVAIWYDKIPDKTVVWYAKSNNDLAEAPAGSLVQLTSEGLKLTTPQGVSIWTAQPDGAVVSYGAMLDTGNFVLVDEESKHVWETFQNPTDTLLPNQSLQLDLDSNLTSRFTETNYTRGRFQLYFQDGNVSLSPLAWPSTNRYGNYYKIDASGSASRLVFDASGDVYVVTTNETKVQLQGTEWDNTSTLNPELNYYRATLDFYGVFTQYAHPRDNTTVQGWTILRYVPGNICTEIFNEVGSGSCGYNSYCSIDNQRPTCKCPDGFSMVDSSNQFGGCQSNFTFDCGADAGPEQELYQLPESTEINFPLGDYASLAPYSQQECQQSCLQDCMCAVAMYSDNIKICWKKSLPLINGRLEKNSLRHIFVKRRVGPLTNYDLPTGHDDSKKVLLGPLIGSLLVNSILLAATVVLFFLLKKRKRIAQPVSLLETNLHSFTYDVLKIATRDFSEELGRGSFGIVYKGTLESELSPNVVAVKRLDRLGQEREKEFKTELSAIGKTFHKNLVRLIGFCDEGINRLLVYEFMSNGNLADVLFGQHKAIWNVRVGFALDIARGLVYLHEECEAPIIHCDIKPQNILIDEFFTAKISDFGLAKLLLSDQSRTNTMIRGTKGYVAPEWFKNVPVTVKVDVYSFGAMLLEIICCRRSVLPMESGEEHKAILTDWAYDCCTEGRIDVLVENDKEALADNGRLQKWVKIAIWCIQEHPEMRPTMRMVMQMLEGVVEVPDPQIPYSFS